MRSINLQSLLQANESLAKESFDCFLRHYGIELRDAELNDLKKLTTSLCDLEANIKILDKFYVSYKIPQIGKEFDLLRFDKHCIINIELKYSSTEEKIKNQLLRNKYYLSFIGRRLYGFTFIADTNELYFLTEDERLEKAKFEFLVELLNSQEINNEEIIDDLFNPSDYLVSPFNSTQKFLKNEYFLTQQQERVKNEIIESLNLPKAVKFFSVTGKAGTGKTLLIYDIAKYLIENKKKPLIIHCGYLNDGQEKLKANGWDIIPIKHYGSYDLTSYDLIIIDEAQRILICPRIDGHLLT